MAPPTGTQGGERVSTRGSQAKKRRRIEEQELAAAGANNNENDARHDLATRFRELSTQLSEPDARSQAPAKGNTNEQATALDAVFNGGGPAVGEDQIKPIIDACQDLLKSDVWNPSPRVIADLSLYFSDMTKPRVQKRYRGTFLFLFCKNEAERVYQYSSDLAFASLVEMSLKEAVIIVDSVTRNSPPPAPKKPEPKRVGSDDDSAKKLMQAMKTMKAKVASILEQVSRPLPATTLTIDQQLAVLKSIAEGTNDLNKAMAIFEDLSQIPMEGVRKSNEGLKKKLKELADLLDSSTTAPVRTKGAVK